MSSAILILSGPSGAGKSTIIQNAKNQIGDFYFSISTTTRSPRDGEVDGVDYYFTDKEHFEEDIKNGEFLEYAKVHGNYYGTSLKPVHKALDEGKLVIFDIDVQGHRLARESITEPITSIFITPPTLQELKKRLLNRKSDDIEIINRRLKNAKDEIQAIEEYDYLIINDDIDIATKAFISIAKASRFKYSNKRLDSFRQSWLEK